MEVLQKSIDFNANNRQLKQKKILFFFGGGEGGVVSRF